MARTFDFSDNLEKVSIKTNEKLDSDYGTFLWPSGVVLAEHIFQTRAQFRGRSVIEIGSGISLPGITAAKVWCL